jgi:hypothetical protein
MDVVKKMTQKKGGIFLPFGGCYEKNGQKKKAGVKFLLVVAMKKKNMKKKGSKAPLVVAVKKMDTRKGGSIVQSDGCCEEDK